MVGLEDRMKEAVSIVSDGTPRGTKVFTESGLELKGIRSITWNIDVDDRISTCTIEVIPSSIRVSRSTPHVRAVELDTTLNASEG